MMQRILSLASVAISLALAGIFQFSAFGQDLAEKTTPDKISLVFTGDIMGHGAQISGAWDPSGKTYNYDSCFIFLKPYLDSADFAIGNLEVTLAGPPYKGYPQFSSPDDLAASLQRSGFDVLVNANNHAADRGPSGALRTIRILDSLGIKHTGTFISEQARDSLVPLMLVKNGFRIALLNYTYGINGLPMPLPAVVSMIDTSRMIRDIEVSRQKQANFILVFVHWGNEYERVPNKSQKELATFLFRHGVDAIIGSHPHVIQPVEAMHIPAMKQDESRLVVWSMGNLVSNQPERYRNGGIVVKVELSLDSTVHVKQSSCIPVFVYRRNEAAGRHFFIIPSGEWISGKLLWPIQPAEKSLLMEFDGDTRTHLGKGMVLDFGRTP